jgi:ADP-ribose pyrophosphatase YjhB (NUDIX family)
MYLAVARPITVGVRAVLVREGQVLLVRHTYQDHWYLPGGGVKRGETLTEALMRELREEVGARVGNVALLGMYSNFYEHKSDHVAVFVCTAFELGDAQNAEIETSAFFALDALPPGASPGTRRRIADYLGKVGPHVTRW